VSGVLNVLSVDVEEYYHALVFQEGTGGVGTGTWPSRVEASMEQVLRLLDDSSTRATFFTLGEVAAEHPALVRAIAREGHEVACHGYRHVRVDGLTPPAFREDVRRAKSILEDLVGEPVLGYRSPNFSIGPREEWARDILLEEGYHYDSSSYPIRHDRYGDPGGRRFPHVVRQIDGQQLVEFPVGTVRLLGVNVPIGGGGYFRLLPGAFARWGIRRVNARERQAVMFYFHPWELDAEQPRPRMPWRNRVRHYVGLRREQGKLAALLRAIPFGTARDVLGIKRA
jgi:polysaccharide deacetylase family protein (PEP-CTERM system associated)